MDQKITTSPKGIKLWWMAVRPFAFPASVMPVVYGSLIALLVNPAIKFGIIAFILCLIGSMLIHVGTNLVNDIYDYKKGLDKEDKEIGIPHGGSLVLSKGYMTPETMTKGAIISIILAGLIGLYLYTIAGIWIIYLMIFGLFTSIFYTAAPLQLKYKALGDIMVFFSFGTGMTVGAYVVQIHSFSWIPVFLSTPFGLLIIAILHSNNLRDLAFDGTFGVKTVAILLGENLSKYYYYVLMIGAYASIIIFVTIGLLPWPALINFITLPAAIKLIRMLKDLPASGLPRWEYGTKHNIMTAQFNTQFGITLVLGMLIAYLFKLGI